jgi:hypothetical protein
VVAVIGFASSRPHVGSTLRWLAGGIGGTILLASFVLGLRLRSVRTR